MVRSAANGYASENKFTALIRRHTGVTPPRVRRLSDVEFDRLLERVARSSTRSQDATNQRSGGPSVCGRTGRSTVRLPRIEIVGRPQPDDADKLSHE